MRGLPVLALALALVLAGAAGAWGGGDVFARAFLALNLPRAALMVTDDAALRGAAHFRMGHMGRAADAFAGDPYNLGVAAAWAGDYATALAAWERRLAAAPEDREAAANIRLVTTLFAGTAFDRFDEPFSRDREGPEMEVEPGKGTGRAAGLGDEATNTTAALGMVEINASGLRRVPKIFDAHFMAASEQWLDTMADEPGLYLTARIKEIRKARRAAGLAPPPPEDPR